MAERRASDLHLTVGRPPLLRIDGQLVPIEGEPLTSDGTKELAYALLTEEQMAAFEKQRELDFSYGVAKVGRFRVNLYRQRGSVGCAIRCIPYAIPTLEELGLPSVVKEFAERPNGLFLVTGPTGSGKSTTLAAIIDYINGRRRCHIITVEDPIEYLFHHKLATIDQREVGTDTTSFAEALRHVMRQDPNVIMVGEMRDLETIHAALTLAETGHLIFATLHTSDTIHAMPRIIDIFPPYQQQQIRVQLSMVLIGVLAQQLIPRKGQPGRALATEMMKVTTPVQNLIRENNLPQLYSVLQTSREAGMHTMNQSLSKLYKDGIISYEEAVRRTNNYDEFIALISSAKEG